MRSPLDRSATLSRHERVPGAAAADASRFEELARFPEFAGRPVPPGDAAA